LFTSVRFTVNHDPASSLFADEFEEFKTKSSQSVVVQDNNFFDFSSIDSDTSNSDPVYHILIN
jgi:hypothetical protein